MWGNHDAKNYTRHLSGKNNVIVKIQIIQFQAREDGNKWKTGHSWKQNKKR